MPDLSNVTVAIGTIEERADLGRGPDAVWGFWYAQLKLAEKEDEDFIKRGRRIIDRYRDERDANEARAAKYNILWSNVETLKPVLYGRIPEPDVARRHRDENDPVARLGAEILERSLTWEDDIEEFDAVMLQVVEDRLLPGRGVARVYYEPQYAETETETTGGDVTGETDKAQPDEDESEENEDEGAGSANGGPAGGMAAAEQREIANERAPLRYVFWEDYRECPARTETEVWWKAYRSYLTREELVERFGEKGKDCGLDYTPAGIAAVASEAEWGPLPDMYKKATVWEIWDKKKRQAVWVAKGYTRGPLDTVDDPLELPGFFPSPPCLRASTTNDQRVPVADYIEYQDQAQELDTLTARIDRLTRALKVAGVYAGSEKMVLQQLVDDASENKMIPVEDWAGFSGDKGGLGALIQWLPVEQIAKVLMQLYDARERVLRIIYQTTGIADILRGETNPIETLGAQQLKTQFATRRITRAQKDVARFARDLLRLRGAVMARHFAPETLMRMSGLPEQLPPLPPPPPMLIPAPNPLGLTPGQGLAGAMPPGRAPVPPGPGPAAMPAPGGPSPGGGRLAPGPPLGGMAVVPAPGGPGVGRGGLPQSLPAGARLAPDGRHYVPDPNRPGKYLMVA